MKILGLGTSADEARIKEAYRQQARLHHPDKCRSNPAAHRRFVEISEAYRMLMTVVRSVSKGQSVGTCQQCGQFGEVYKGVDGWMYCARCSLRPTPKRLLPLPRVEVVKCIGAIGVLLVAIYCLFFSFFEDPFFYRAIAFVTGLLSMAILAHTAIRVVYCTNKRERVLLGKLADQARGGAQRSVPD
jgi:hypothetical protein